MDATTTTIAFVALSAVAALALTAIRPRRRPSIGVRPGGRSTWPVRSSSHQWLGGDPVYYFGGDASSADCGGGADGGGGGGGCD